jgi:hypothetical protein
MNSDILNKTLESSENTNILEKTIGGSTAGIVIITILSFLIKFYKDYIKKKSKFF